MAMEPFEKAITRMLCKDELIFFAHIIAQLKRTENMAMKTAGVYVADGRMHLEYNPDWFGKLDSKEQSGILQHEIMHLILEHILRGKNLDHYKFNIAADVAVNHFIPTLPEGALRAPQFDVADGKSAEWYYKHIKFPKQQCVCGSCGKPITGKGKCKCGGSPVPSQDIKPLDDHSVWDKSTSNQYSKEVIKQAVKRAVENTKRGRGSLPGNLESVVNRLLAPPQVPWYVVLRQYVANQIRAGKRSSWKRENRRYGEDMKGRVSDWTFKIGIAIDTSGSISVTDLKLFTAEIAGIMKAHKTEITLMENDDAIQNVWKLTKYNISKLNKINFHGGGGTDFRHVFRYVRDKHLNIHVLVFLTDMYGIFPEERPPYETIWVSCSEETKAPWGKVIKINQVKVNTDGEVIDSDEDEDGN